MSGFGNNNTGGFGQPSSGFGGGFGQPQQSPQQTFGFGGQQQQQTQAQPSTPSGFVGQQIQAQQTSSFGTGFGSTPSPAVANNVGFGSSSTSSGFSGGFGQSSATSAPSSTGNTTTSGGFGNTPSGGGFGHAQTSQQTGFGGASTFGQTQSSQQPSGFGQSTQSQTSSGFGTSNSSGFGQQLQQQQSTPSSFGGRPTISPSSGGGSLVFGSSSTVVTNNNQVIPTNAPLSSSKTATGFVPAAAAASPFVSSGFGSSSTSFGGGGGGGVGGSNTTTQGGLSMPSTTPRQDKDKQPPTGSFGAASPTAFGGATTSGFGSGGFGSSTTASQGGDPSVFGQRIPRKSNASSSQGGLSANATPFHSNNTNSNKEIAAATDESDKDGSSSGDAQLAALRAKIQKKKHLLKKKQTQSISSEGTPTNDNSKTKIDQKGEGMSRTELAAKNALRFATSNNDQTLNSLLPSDLKARSNATDDGIGQIGEEETEGDEDDSEFDDTTRNLSSAKSLVGICMSMCPDEELLRREREGDIQLLEVTDPGGLHPKEWTLRNTAVKRFRRSAADFKLNIPELVRPPEVLERVCGYLEEWIMERDRQGPDKRWAQQPSDTPPPLDVYQFVWDRTRMIRKDFILQNYIGTGGKCDARAVRCHERIARWHAMCEHQLSHVPEFVSHQSQQNIAELGQTMKSLNNYYDDSLGRSLIEVDTSNIQSHRLATAAEGGNTSANDLQGCASDIIMGKDPIDFDGTKLVNNNQSNDTSRRIIGSNGVKSKSLGTAEPEMRGLYILLTLNNEGGMEVLKYVGRLCVQKPAIFYSKPVQLALSIFQAKKDHNYARFFSLLRSPETPYLFACIMFKYVENMRKDALTIMSKTYGAKHKTTGQPFFDAYPLENLVKLLCYESKEEASTACQHYGLVVEGDEVMWRHGRFREPRDPEKGHIIPLKPRKMIRTIESKLQGATRLSVCRGGVSGMGATLSDESCGKDIATVEEDRKKAQEAAEQARKEAMMKQMEAEAKARLQAEIIEKERLKRNQIMLAEQKARAEAERRAEIEQLEKERIQRERMLAEQRRAEAKAAAKRAEREKREREARELELARKRAEEEEKERKRQLLLAKQREEEARRLAEIKAAKERAEQERREEEEHRRLAELRRKAEEERIRKAREEEARRIELMWREKIEKARKILAWLTWRKQMQKHESNRQSIRCLEMLDPTDTKYPAPLVKEVPSIQKNLLMTRKSTSFDDLESQIYRLATAARPSIDLSRIVADCLWNSSATIPTLQPSRAVNLFKLAVILPQRVDGVDFYNTLRMWVDSHLTLNHFCSYTFKRRSQEIEVRTVTVLGNEDDEYQNCNAALFLLPSSAGVNSNIEYPDEVDELISQNVSRMVLVLDDGTSTEKNSTREDILDHLVGSIEGPNGLRQGVATPMLCHLDDAFRNCCETLVETHFDSVASEEERVRISPHVDPSLVRVPLVHLGFVCLQQLLQNMAMSCTQSSVFSSCQLALTLLVDELSHATKVIHQTLHNWPPLEFGEEGSNSIPSYFDGKYGLPFNWHFPLTDIRNKVFGIFQEFLEENSFVEFVNQSVEKLSLSQRQQVFTLIDNEEMFPCFSYIISLVIDGELNIETSDETILYLPAETLSKMIERVSAYEPPFTPEHVLDREIPSYLYQSGPIHTEEKENDSIVENVINETPDIVEERAVVVNKRKPSETPVNERIKRVRSNNERTSMTEEERRSKEYTSFLEALLG